MNPRNPIDDLFRQRLEHYEEELPYHLWAAIDQSGAPRRRRLAVRRWRRLGLTAAAVLLAGLAPLLLPSEPAPTLGSFPIPEHQAATARALPATPALPPPPADARPWPASPLPAPATAALPAAAPATTAPVLTAAPPLPEPVAAPDRPVADGPLRSLPGLPVPILDRDPQCVRFGQPGSWALYADASLGPAYAASRFRARSGESDAYAQARRDTETPELSYTAALRLSVVTDFGLALRSGLQYSQFHDKFEYLDNSEERITITNIFGPNGEIIGTDTLIEKGVRRELAHNRYRLLDIPLLLGYELSSGKWTLAFNGGALLNLFFHARGSFLSPEELRPTGFSSGRDAGVRAYRTDVGVNWYASLGLHYRLQDDLQLMVEPHFRYTPASVTHAAYGLEHRYLAGGLSVGLRKRL